MSILTKPYFQERKNNGVLFEPDSSCVLWLPGQDDAYSATIRDRSGKGNHGTITGAIWTRNSRGLWVLNFDGTDDIVKVPFVHPTWEAYSQGAFELWFKTAGNGDLMDVSEENYTDGRYYIRFYVNTQLYVSQKNNDVNDVIRGGTTVTDNKWHLAQLVSNGTAYAIYLDGQPESLTVVAGANTGDWISDCTPATMDYLTVGAWNNLHGIVQELTGSCGLPRMYNLALSSAIALNHYNQERHLFG